MVDLHRSPSERSEEAIPLHPELQALRAHLDEAQRAARMGSWIWDVTSDRVTWSDELYRIFGLPPASDCSVESHLDRVHADDRERVRELMQRAAAEGTGFALEERIVRPTGEERRLRSRAQVVLADDGSALLVTGTCQDVTDQIQDDARAYALFREQELRRNAEEQEQRAAFMAEAATLLASSLDREETLRSLAALAVPRLADWCTIDVLDDDGGTKRLVVAHPDPRKAELARDLHRRYPPDPEASFGVPQVLRTGEPELVSEIPAALIDDAAEDEEQRQILRDLGLTSYMIVPLTASGRIYGAISLVTAESGKRFDEEDLRFALDLSGRAALAMENARLYQDAQRVRVDLEQQSSVTRIVTENTTAALFMMDARGHCTYLNAAAEAMTGFTAAELAAMPLHDAIHHKRPDGSPYPLEECPIDRALPEDNSIRSHEDVFIRKDGTLFPVVCAASPIFDREGRAIGTVVEVRDVTEERLVEAALRDRDRQFRFLADSIPVQVWTAAPDGRLDYVNQQVEHYFGDPAEQILGEGWVGKLVAEQIPTVIDAWSRSLATGEPYEVEFLLRRADGEYRWHLARARPQRDPSGQIVRWFGSNTDVHEARETEEERKRMSAQREQERTRLLEVFQQAPAFICTLSGPQHVFESANPLYFQLVGRRDIIGKPVGEALPEVTEQGFVQLLDQVYASGEAFVGTELPVQLRRSPEQELEAVYVNFVYQPMRDVAGAINGIFVHGVEVTEQVRGRQEMEAKAEELARLARQLQISNEELDQFAYVASHDLKAPLRGIANLSQWIEEDLSGTASGEVKEHLEKLRGRVLRMEGLIDGILQFSRAGRARGEPERVEVRELLREVVDLTAPPPAIAFEIDEGLPILWTEKLPLQQVFMNLIGNAAKFVADGAGGRIEVGGEPEGAYHRFYVRDNGPGVAPEFHDRIFGIFQTLHARDQVEGTGIGLSLVKKIVESRGGRVWIESQEGAGATFHFLWPKDG